MTVVRQIIAAFMAVSLVWVGSAVPVHAHTHELTDHHSSALHLISVDLGHGHQHDDDDHDHHVDHEADTPAQDGQAPHEHEKGIFHVHTMTFVALAAEPLSLVRSGAIGGIDMPVLVVPLHTRNVLPADRPPRTFL